MSWELARDLAECWEAEISGPEDLGHPFPGGNFPAHTPLDFSLGPRTLPCAKRRICPEQLDREALQEFITVGLLHLSAVYFGVIYYFQVKY